MYRAIVLVISLCFLQACNTIFAERLTLRPIGFLELEQWTSDNHKEALETFIKSCESFKKRTPEKNFTEGIIPGHFAAWKGVCSDAKLYVKGNDVDARYFFETRFQPYKAGNFFDTKGIFTGYYEIGLKGSRKKHGRYQYPIYSKPDSLVPGKKFYSRKQIDSGVLSSLENEIVWVNDPVQLFFLHIQGSGKVILDTDETIKVGYAGKNGHPYTSIGKYLINQGHIKRENMSAPAIKDWLYKNKEEAFDVMHKNKSYVFFREMNKNENPIGAQGIPLTPGRSMAVDKKYIPYGVPIWVDVQRNATPNYPAESLRRILIAQDTGGAIKGPVRGDIFFGYGPKAEELAGFTNAEGEYYLLLPKALKL